MLPFCPDPPYFPLTHPAPRPSLACPLSYMWHGCLLLPVTSQAVHWPLHFWCWQAKLEAWRPIRTHTRTHTEFKGTSSKKKKSFQMTKHRLLDECLLRLFFVFSVFSSEVHHCISVYLSFPFFLPLLCIDICISVFIGCPVFLSLRSIFIFFFLLLLSVFLFPSCFTVFYCFCLGFNFLFTLSVHSVCLSLSL